MVTRIVRILAACMLLGTTLAFVAVTPVAAGQQNASCAASDVQNVRFFENAIGDTSDGNDQWVLCSTNADNDFQNNAHTLAGQCKAPIIVGDEWNDCISSVQAEIPANVALCLYATNLGSSGPSSQKLRINPSVSNQRINLSGTTMGTDGLTGFKFISYSSVC